MSTADYDFRIHRDDIAAFNEILARFERTPDRSPHDAQLHGRYVLANDEKVDVVVARDDLIRTKRFAARPKDLEDIRLLEILRSAGDAE